MLLLQAPEVQPSFYFSKEVGEKDIIKLEVVKKKKSMKKPPHNRTIYKLCYCCY